MSTFVPVTKTTSDVWDYSISNTTMATEEDGIPLSRIIVCSILFCVTVLTIIGNAVVLLAFFFDRSLTHNIHFNFYVINLAITDFLVGITAMSFYTFDVLLGYWPFGEFLCGVWIFFDYGMTFASVFTLVAISGDRYWSVAWYIHYRTHNTRRKTFIVIFIVWLAVLAVWLGPCILDRVRWSEPNFCKWEPSRNRAVVAFIAIIGHHTPCAIMVFCYIRVAAAMLMRRGVVSSRRAGQAAGNSSTGDDSANEAGGEKGKTASKQGKANDDKERKIFVTLSYIILSYLVCWVPFHVVFDISAVDPYIVPEPVYTATFWLTYFNSTLNPFLYAFSSKEFRSAFKMVIKCQCFSKSRVGPAETTMSTVG